MARLTTGGDTAALSKELSDFLLELSIALHKNAIYPAGHPLLENTSSELCRRVETLLKERESISLGVARHQLIIEGVATDDSNPVLRELALRLHRHHLGAVKFMRGVNEDEIVRMLATVSRDTRQLPRPLGMEGPEVLAQWAHIRLFPLTFAQLQLLEEDGDAPPVEGDDSMKASGSGSRSAQLWIGLARAALVTDRGAKFDDDDERSVDPTVIAQAIEEHKRDAAYDQVVVGYMLQINEEIKQKGSREQAALTRRVSQLVGNLSPEALQRLLKMGGDARQRRKFVTDAAQGMDVDAVVELMKAAANTSGQTISHSMVRMLSKMAVHADGGSAEVRTAADGALREQVSKLVQGWQLDDPNPDGYRLTLERMATAAPVFQSEEHSFPIEPERLLAMGLEIEILGAQVWRSADAMAQAPDITPLLNLVDNAPAVWMREALWRHVATPQRLRLQLALDPLPMTTLHRMVRKMGTAAAEPILDALDEAQDERGQERLIELLGSIGAPAGPMVLARLAGMRWALVRPLITLLGRNPDWKCGYDASRWLVHPDPLVRREALRQQLRSPETRDAAIVRALADADEATVRLALGAAINNCPRDAALMLRVRADDGTLSPDLRALGIRALSSHKASDTASWLVHRIVKMGKVLKRPSLAPKTPELLAALEGLATHWREDKVSKEAIALAEASGDAEIRGAVAARRERVSGTEMLKTAEIPASLEEPVSAELPKAPE